MLVTEPETCLGAWGLIDSDPATGDPTQQDTDVILLLSQRAVYVARCDAPSRLAIPNFMLCKRMFEYLLLFL